MSSEGADKVSVIPLIWGFEFLEGKPKLNEGKLVVVRLFRELSDESLFINAFKFRPEVFRSALEGDVGVSAIGANFLWVLEVHDLVPNPGEAEVAV